MAIRVFESCAVGLSLLVLTAAWVSTPKQSSGQPISDDELARLCEQLFQLDVNNQVRAVQVDLQGRTTASRLTDEARNPLLHVDSSVRNVSTIGLLMGMYDYYEPDTSKPEKLSPEKLRKENEFLDALLATSVLSRAMDFLAKKGHVAGDRAGQRKFLHQLWFAQYSRGGGILGSSGFEHVFMGELKNSEVSGFHNWVYFNQEEIQGTANYMGYMRALDLKKATLVKLRFSWHGNMKPVNSMLVGTSPELEMALYSVCFAARAGTQCPLQLGGKDFFINVYAWTLKGGRGTTIASAYPGF